MAFHIVVMHSLFSLLFYIITGEAYKSFFVSFLLRNPCDSEDNGSSVEMNDLHEVALQERRPSNLRNHFSGILQLNTYYS